MIDIDAFMTGFDWRGTSLLTIQALMYGAWTHLPVPSFGEVDDALVDPRPPQPFFWQDKHRNWQKHGGEPSSSYQPASRISCKQTEIKMSRYVGGKLL